MNHSGGLSGLPMLGLIIVLGLAYLLAVRRVHRVHSVFRWPRRYTGSFGIGLVLTALVTVGPVASAATERFSVHMVQHIVLMMLSTPFLLLGAPVLLAMCASESRVRRRLRRVLRNPVFLVLTNPVVSWVLFACVLVSIHFTDTMSWLMAQGTAGQLGEQLLYITVAAAFYYTLLPGNPAFNRPHPAFRVLSLFLMMIPETMTGFFLYTASLPKVPMFVDAAAMAGQDPLLDQRFGGALMWSGAMIIDVAWIALAVYDWLRSESSKTRRLEARERTQLTGGRDA